MRTTTLIGVSDYCVFPTRKFATSGNTPNVQLAVSVSNIDRYIDYCISRMNYRNFRQSEQVNTKIVSLH
jgi:hypothetical protein